MKKLAPLFLTTLLLTSPLRGEESPSQYPDSIIMTLPGGKKKIDCTILGPERKISIAFLMQMHEHQDAFTDYITKKYDNLDLKGAAATINHLVAHGVSKEEIKRVIREAGVSNVNFGNASATKPSDQELLQSAPSTQPAPQQ